MAIAAVDGYVLEVFDRAREHTRTVLNRAADLAPELSLIWQPHVPPGDFEARVASQIPGTLTALIEDPTPLGALQEARIWFAAAPVVTKVAPTTDPATLGEAARAAQDRLNHVVITDQAVVSADLSPFERPLDVLRDLQILDEIVGSFDSTDPEGLGGPRFEAACGARGLLFSRDISPIARQRHEGRYTVVWDGQPKIMGPHLRFGGSYDPKYCARVYWWIDHDGHRLIVGHVGHHLPGSDE
jgi:hypothetical protein